MPRHYFHVRSADKTIVNDDEGTDLPDLEAARAKARKSAQEIVDDMISLGEAPGDQRYVVMDTRGQIVFEYAFRSTRLN